MTAYAAITDIEERLGRSLSEPEQTKAGAFINDATIYIAAQAKLPDPLPSDKIDLLRSVCCAVVLRAMQTQNFGVTSMQQTAGAYSESLSFANPSGDLYLTHAEKGMLGVGKQKLGAIRPEIRSGVSYDW